MTAGCKRIGVLGAVVVTLLVSTPRVPAGHVEDGDGETTLHLSLYSVPDPSRTDVSTRADVAVVNEFKRRFPSIFAEKYRARYENDPETYGRHDWSTVSVELHPFSGIRVEGIDSDLLAIAGQVAPDILYVNFRKSDTYIQQGFLYPLDRPEDGYLTAMTEEELALRIHEKIWPVIRRKGPTGAEHVWALPYGGALGKVLLYRKDLFDEAGVPYPTAEWTWDDLYAAARALTDPDRGIYGLRFGRGRDESWFWISYLWSTGAELMTYDAETDTWEIGFDVPEAAVALDFYTRLCTEPWTDAKGKKRYGYAYKDPAETYIKWRRGELAMATSYIEEKMFSTINPDITGMAPVPKGPTGIRGAELNSRMMGIFSGIEDPVIRDLAWEYMRFFDGRDAGEIRTRVLVEGGLGHFVNPTYLEMFGYEELIRLSPPGWKETFEIAIATGKPEPYGRHSNITPEILTEPIQRAEAMALAGELPDDPDERLAVMHGLLKEAAAKARRDILGVVPPAERTKQRVTAALFLVLAVMTFAFVFRKVVQAYTPITVDGSRRDGWQFGKYRVAYFLLMPAVLTILVWQYVPLIRGSLMSFQDYRVIGNSSWVGLDNFGSVLWDTDWWISVWNGVRYSFLVVALAFLPPIVLAILLQEVPKGKILFRTLYYLPAVITGLVVILLWKSFYDPSETGILNVVLMRVPSFVFLGLGLALFALSAVLGRRLLYHDHAWIAAGFFAAGVILFSAAAGLAAPALNQDGLSLVQRLLSVRPEPVRWLGDPRTAMLACVLPTVWAGIGPGCLIYLAALKGVPDDYYEASDIDGATFADKILFIVFPILRPLILINFIGVFIGSWFGATANILAMTGGGSNTEVAGLNIFYRAFIYIQFGPATAMAWILGFILIGFTVYQLRILSRLEFRTTGD